MMKTTATMAIVTDERRYPMNIVRVAVCVISWSMVDWAVNTTGVECVSSLECTSRALMLDALPRNASASASLAIE